jgi:hypothetical protein
MRKTPELDRDGMSLEDFLVSNQVSLACMAVFAALLAFSGDLKPALLGGALSFILIGGLVLIWFEVWYKLPQKLGLRLFLFRYILLWGIAIILLYWVYEYRLIWDMALFVPYTIIAMGLIVSSVIPPIRSLWITRRIFGIDSAKKNGWQKFARGISIIALAGVSLFLGIYFSFGTNVVLDAIRQAYP